MSKEEVGDVLKLLDAYYFIYIPSLTIIFGSTNTGIFLSYLLYWHGRGMRKDGWIFKTIEEAKLETGLSRFQQDAAIKALVKYGVLEVDRKEARGRRHFRLNDILLFHKLSEDKAKFKIMTHGMRVARKQQCHYPTNAVDDFSQSLTKDTAHSKQAEEDFFATFDFEKIFGTAKGDLPPE